MKIVAVIDYGMGNLHSASKALEHVAGRDTRVVVTCDPQTIQQADRVVLPGVGAIRDCMAEIRHKGVDDVVREVVASERPLLGICVGMQVMLDHSEENGGVECLGVMSGNVKFFGRDLKSPAGEKLKVPHMGWSRVDQHQPHALWEGIENNERFYFVHSYHAHAVDDEVAVGRCDYGVSFDVALASDAIFAVQFHPEKSAASGLKLLENFLQWTP
ncbi:imidazole glycerol phosphate synthase subunit HisH [Endozoicomonas euniceicola]|uniref:Imidazole glycerol phosphate synthase subunit HisH n=1 Tax=Endozoicomonas euniceicola TaxID=1234143 RepID=A0ABY6H065_9GAMM|nr:imidazole glycerol phosphate synthase subunit HisH [Endozoicomonas euniceicola]UYM18442.1 imidazole glycerol phosphate synthase subunit HisH [Endozoicomonas euniceicola]